MNPPKSFEEILEEKQKEGKVELLNKSTAQMEKENEVFNKYIEESRNQYIYNDALSNISASKTILTT